MPYARFEKLVVAVGFAAIAGSILLSLRGPIVLEEIVAQLLLLGVLIAAAHWGRNGGFIAALAASLIYIVIRIPLVIESEGLTGDLAALLATRILSYGLVGIVGGELCSRLKYLFARLERSSSVDEWSQVYNQHFITRAVESALGHFDRYHAPFSVIAIEVAPALTAELRPSRHRMLVRGIANHIRNDIRLVDEVGRLEDGRYLVVLPHTPHEGALVAAERIAAGIADVLGAKTESVSTHVLSVPEDRTEVSRLIELLQVPARDPGA
ncbi:MAG: hypothetical protein KGZ40_05645 [Clostridiales bacterium]|nr:hypothetical protein [Clostridiales bacterium]